MLYYHVEIIARGAGGQGIKVLLSSTYSIIGYLNGVSCVLLRQIPMLSVYYIKLTTE